MSSIKNFLPKPAFRLPAYFLFSALGALVALSTILASPSEPRNALFLGYSATRLTLIVGMLLLTFTLLFLTWKLVRQPEDSLRLWQRFVQQRPMSDLMLTLSTTVFLAVWIALLTPSYRLAGNISEYAVRLYPVLVWLAVVSAAAMLVLILSRAHVSLSSVILAKRTTIQAGAVILLFFLFVWAITALTGIGLRDREDYWYGAGVPVLGLQVLFSLTIGGFVLWLESRRNILFKNDILLFVALWAVTAWLWARGPLVSNYFMPETAGNLPFPYSDSATFDIASQAALIGEGLFGGLFFDRVLYSAFLAYLHALVGQDYAVLMAVQAGVLAVFPAIVYLIGRELHSHALGISAGILVALRGVNSIIVAKWVDTASPKMLLTDFPAAIGLALILLFALKWMKNPQKLPLVVWAGCALGMTIMLRTHALLLLPVLLFVFFFQMKPRWKVAALGALLLVLGMLSATLPWDIRNRSNGMPLFYVYYSRIEVILHARYGLGQDITPQIMPSIPGEEEGHVRMAQRGLIRAVPDNDAVCNSLPCSIVNHFFHNLITSTLFLPNSLVFDDLWNTVKLGAPYWKQDWTGGDVANGHIIFIGLNLVIVSIGIGSLWEARKFKTLLALSLFFMYATANSVGFTSGGRYIVPMDWLIVLFFMAGLLQLVTWFLQWTEFLPASYSIVEDQVVEHKPMLNSASMVQVAGTLTLTFMLGALIPLADVLFEKRYQSQEPVALLSALEEQGFLLQAGFEKEDLSDFLKDPQARILEGRVLYPRYYLAGAGEPKLNPPYMINDHPRLAFTLIGPGMPSGLGVVLAGEMPSLSLHMADVVVIGCVDPLFGASSINAIAVIVKTGPVGVLYREPSAPLQCPLQEP
jgi:hypothetical protein